MRWKLDHKENLKKKLSYNFQNILFYHIIRRDDDVSQNQLIPLKKRIRPLFLKQMKILIGYVQHTFYDKFKFIDV